MQNGTVTEKNSMMVSKKLNIKLQYGRKWEGKIVKVKYMVKTIWRQKE